MAIHVLLVLQTGNCLCNNLTIIKPDNYQQKVPVLLFKGQKEGYQINLHIVSRTTCITKV